MSVILIDSFHEIGDSGRNAAIDPHFTGRHV